MGPICTKPGLLADRMHCTRPMLVVGVVVAEVVAVVVRVDDAVLEAELVALDVAELD